MVIRRAIVWQYSLRWSYESFNKSPPFIEEESDPSGTAHKTCQRLPRLKKAFLLLAGPHNGPHIAFTIIKDRQRQLLSVSQTTHACWSELSINRRLKLFSFLFGPEWKEIWSDVGFKLSPWRTALCDPERTYVYMYIMYTRLCDGN